MKTENIRKLVQTYVQIYVQMYMKIGIVGGRSQILFFFPVC